MPTVVHEEKCLGLAFGFMLLAPNPKGLGAFNLGSVHTSVCPYGHPSVRTDVRTSVDSNFSAVYGSNSLKLYTKIRYGLRIMYVKYIFDIIQNGGHLGCKHTWSRNSNNTNWIAFKFGAERKLGMANMYAHLFSVQFKKMAT